VNEFEPDYNIKEIILDILKDLQALIRKMMLNIDRGDTTLLSEHMAEIDSIKDELNLIGQLDAKYPLDPINFEKLNSTPPLSDNLRMLIHYLEKRSYTKALDHLDGYVYGELLVNFGHKKNINTT